MFSKIGILVWEQRRNSLQGLGIIAAVMVVYALLLHFVGDLVHRIFARSDSLTMGVAFVPILGAVALLFLNENRNVIRFDYPRRMFIWPVRTWLLVSTQLLYKIVAITLLTLAASMICRFFIYEKFIWWPPLLAAAVAIVVLQAVVFLTMAFGGGTGLAIAVLLLVVSYPGFAEIAGAHSHVFARHEEPEELVVPVALPLIATGILLLGWWIVAVVAAQRARCEVPDDRIGFGVRMMSGIARFERSEHDFRSREEAQRWYEWRRGPFLYPWLAVGAGFLLSAVMGSASTGMHERFQFFLIMLGLAPAAVACLVGYSLTRQDAMYAWFVGARPISNRAISAARIAASLKALGIGYALLILAFVVGHWVQFPESPLHPTLVEDMRETTITTGPVGEGWFIVCLYVAIVMLAVWTIFWLGRAAGIAIWIAGVFGVIQYYKTGNLYEMTAAEGATSPVLQTFILALTIVAMVAVVGVYAAAVWRGEIGMKIVGLGAVGAALLALSAFAFREYIPLSPAWMVAIWMMVPILPFASLPLTVAIQRNG